jgi:hypothetical protein
VLAVFVPKTGAFSTRGRPLATTTSHQSSATVIVRRLSFNENDGNGDGDGELERIEEEARLRVLESRRETIRGTLKGAELLRNFRLEKGTL